MDIRVLARHITSGECRHLNFVAEGYSGETFVAGHRKTCIAAEARAGGFVD